MFTAGPAIWAADSRDPYFSSTTLLLNFNEGAGATAWTDKSSLARAVTRHGAAVGSTAHVLDGASSLQCTGGPSCGVDEATSAGSLLPGDFTCEGWFYLTSAPSVSMTLYNLNCTTASKEFSVYITAAGKLAANLRQYSNGDTILGATTISASAWHHFALVRSGTAVTLYLDGVSQGTSSSSLTHGDSRFDFIGTNWTVDSLTGWIDAVRVTKVARYTATFTPPTSFPES